MNQYRNTIFDNIIESISAELPKGHCVEIGCGSGRYLLPISKATAQNIIGIDLQLPKDVASFSFVQADALSLPFNNESFAAAYMIQSLHQIRDWKKVLVETRRILRKGGSIIIHTLSHAQLSEVLTLKFTPAALDLDLKRYPEINEIQSFLFEIGFNEIKMEEIKNVRTFSRKELIQYIESKANSAFRRLYEENGEVWFQRMMEDAIATIPDTSTLDEPHNSTLISAKMHF